ncbi:hypothetical protein AB832_03565 [Flavobacteriaceae bacterium (ex Bugula neritina AB1)]|nr:hypothetical protein AB832_03565 [Flavobacteriaceae bacterium (ex Bugula neritina AB1)]
MSQGFIKLGRDIRGTWIHKNPIYFRAWCDILMTVNYTPQAVSINGKTLICGEDESLLSLESWAQLFGSEWNKGKVRRFFDRLKKEHVISTIPDTKTTRLKVLKSKYYRGQQHDNSTIIARYPTPIEEGKKETTTTIGEITEKKPLGIDEARNVLLQEFGNSNVQVKNIQKAYKEQTGFKVDETTIQLSVCSFLQKGMTKTYKGRIKEDSKVIAYLMKWITNERKFDRTNKLIADNKKKQETKQTLAEYLKDNYRPQELKRMDVNKLEKIYNSNSFLLTNVSKGYQNENITPYLLFELCFMPYGQKIGGRKLELKIETFKRFFKQLSNYNQNKGDIRKLLKEWGKTAAQ